MKRTRKNDAAYIDTGWIGVDPDTVRVFLREIGRVPLIDHSQEMALGMKIVLMIRLTELQSDPDYCEENARRVLMDEFPERTDELADVHFTDIISVGMDAKRKLIAANLRLVVTNAKRYQNRGLDFLDLIQEGTIGLNRAAEKYDYRKGYKFSTYATWWIRQSISRSVAEKGRNIRTPVHITEKRNKIEKLRKKMRLAGELKGERSLIDRAIGEKIIPDEKMFYMIYQACAAIYSLDKPLGGNEDSYMLVDVIIDDQNSVMSLEDETDSSLLSTDLEAILLRNLTQLEQKVISLRYGLGVDIALSREELTHVMKFSREKLRQIETKALRKLRSPRIKKLLTDHAYAVTGKG